jgi:multiple sugar transport system substrate-binding protein
VRVRSGGRRKRASALLVALAVAAGVLAACGSSISSDSSDSTGEPTPTSGSTTATSPSTPAELPPETLTFGVIGPAAEVQQYRTMAETFAPPTRHVTVKVESWPDDAAMLASFRAGEQVPDVFLATQRHLPYLVQHRLVQPVDALLDDRGFDFGDEFPRSSLTAFGSDNRLVCLPYGVQPSVIFYNKRLLQFSELKNDPPTPGEGWSLGQFAAAARWATRHHPGVAGISLDPTLLGVAPFVYSGGGDLFDDPTTPTSTALSDDANTQSLTQTVRALHAPGTMLTQGQLRRHSALEWFERGKLAMLEGSRRMVPDLRGVPGLRFDVMPMPTLGSPATVGTLTGLCLSQSARDVATAADFLVYASSPGALALVAFDGYLQPANQTSALSDAFQQPGEPPKHASVFTFSVKSMVYPPPLDSWDQLEESVDPLVEQLLKGDPSQVPRTARRIDRASYRILGPRLGPSAQPSS